MVVGRKAMLSALLMGGWGLRVRVCARSSTSQDHMKIGESLKHTVFVRRYI